MFRHALILFSILVISQTNPINFEEDIGDIIDSKHGIIPQDNVRTHIIKRDVKDDSEGGVLRVFASMKEDEMTPEKKEKEKKAKAKKEKATKKPKVAKAKPADEIVLMKCEKSSSGSSDTKGKKGKEAKGKKCVDVDMPYDVRRTAVELVKSKKKTEVPARNWGGVFA